MARAYGVSLMPLTIPVLVRVDADRPSVDPVDTVHLTPVTRQILTVQDLPTGALDRSSTGTSRVLEPAGVL